MSSAGAPRGPGRHFDLSSRSRVTWTRARAHHGRAPALRLTSMPCAPTWARPWLDLVARFDAAPSTRGPAVIAGAVRFTSRARALTAHVAHKLTPTRPGRASDRSLLAHELIRRDQFRRHRNRVELGAAAQKARTVQNDLVQAVTADDAHTFVALAMRTVRVAFAGLHAAATPASARRASPRRRASSRRRLARRRLRRRPSSCRS